MKMSLFLIVILLFIAFITNPEEREHERAFREYVADATNSNNPIFDGLYYVFAKEVVSRKNYWLFSITVISSVDGASAPIGFGMFGKVVIFKYQ